MTARKLCGKCNKRKSVTTFYKSQASSDGYGSQCKECMNATRARNKAKTAASPKVVPATKVCRKCRETKTANDFSPAPASADGLYSYCKRCKSLMVKKHRDENKEALNRNARAKAATPEGRVKQRNQNLQYRFGVGQEYYEARLNEQAGVCAICQRAREQGEKHYSIDHEHDKHDVGRGVAFATRTTPPKLRGVLCERCNRGLGLASDDVHLLLRMARYLEHHAKRQPSA